MFRQVLAVVVMLVCVGFLVAEDISGVITKVADGKVTFAKGTFNKETKTFEKGEAQTLPVADGVKVVKGKFDKETKKVVAGDALEGGIKNEVFTNIGEKGVRATVTVDGGKITQIIVSGGKGKTKPNN